MPTSCSRLPPSPSPKPGWLLPTWRTSTSCDTTINRTWPRNHHYVAFQSLMPAALPPSKATDISRSASGPYSARNPTQPSPISASTMPPTKTSTKSD
ncbi:hypothetical protein ACFFX0_25980 [Citricoccus parietis]|uniref:Uncharacterized protein n=1 Tax=Citricoccus parietis TaxID=592307 RepID=A0ABV5G669_9MICC